MPVQRGKDSNGPYYKWGQNGKRYYYSSGNTSSRTRAHHKAEKQGRAIQFRKHTQ